MKCAKKLNLPIRADKYVKNSNAKLRVPKAVKPHIPLEEKQKLVDRAIELQAKEYEMRGNPMSVERITYEKNNLLRHSSPRDINFKIKQHETWIFNRTNIPAKITMKKQELIDHIVSIWKQANEKSAKTSTPYVAIKNIDMETIALMNSTPKDLEMSLRYARQLVW
jgi:hypothetical protein